MRVSAVEFAMETRMQPCSADTPEDELMKNVRRRYDDVVGGGVEWLAEPGDGEAARDVDELDAAMRDVVIVERVDYGEPEDEYRARFTPP